MSRSEIPNFSKIDDITSLYRPPQANGNTTPSSPTTDGPCLVVLCTWMAAAPKHIAKYTEGYRTLYPQAEILLIQAPLPAMFFGSDLTGALNYLAQYAEKTELTRRPILLHMFSNGGARNACDLTSRLYELYGRNLVDVMVLDCCPGRGDLKGATNAMAYSLPKQPVVRFLGWYMLYATLCIYLVITIVFGFEDIIIRIRRILNDQKILAKGIPRLYLYSKADALVRSQDVHDHVEEALRAGYLGVREEVFTVAPHCALLNEDASRYWDAVKACCSRAKFGNGSLK